MKKEKIKIGYEIKTGKEIDIPMAHTVITGLTQESGKTTCIMGLVKRSGLKALIIKTKIGEKAVTEGSILPPFYKEDFDWEYAAELLEASRKEKLKFERSWIIRYSKGANNLLEFKRNIDNALANEKLRDLDKSVLISLQAYLDKILPELQYAPLSKTLDIQDGINIMDLERFKPETQMLVIRSVLNEVLTNEKGIIIVIPEAWKIVPEDFMTPVKRPAEEFIRQGATNQNYLWIDSQDITGTSKVILKQVSNWILGYQREINEIKRTLDQMPLPKTQKPKPEDIATLKLGQFFVATSEFTKKVYSQPTWLSDKDAIKVATGKLNVNDLEQPTQIAPYKILPTKSEEIVSGVSQEIPMLFDANKKINELRQDFLSNRNDFFNKFQEINDTISKIYSELFQIKSKPMVNEDELVMRVLQKMPMQQSPINEEALIAKILEKVPKMGMVTNYTVAPLEKLKKDFLEGAKQKILNDVQNLSNDAKKTLKYLESRGVGVATSEIVTKGFLLSPGGGSQDRINKSIKELSAIEAARKDTGGKTFGELKNRIKNLLSLHGATDQEIEQVYQHILMEMLKC